MLHQTVTGWVETRKAKGWSTIARVAALAALVALVAMPSLDAQDVVARGRFVVTGHPSAGGVRVVRSRGGLALELEADFVTKPGPDLALFFVEGPVARLDNRNATRGAIRVGELQRARGAQRYALPADLDTRRFRTVIVHSETFSKLWGGADLR